MKREFGLTCTAKGNPSEDRIEKCCKNAISIPARMISHFFHCLPFIFFSVDFYLYSYAFRLAAIKLVQCDTQSQFKNHLCETKLLQRWHSMCCYRTIKPMHTRNVFRRLGSFSLDSFSSLEIYSCYEHKYQSVSLMRTKTASPVLVQTLTFTYYVNKVSILKCRWFDKYPNTGHHFFLFTHVDCQE